MALGWMTKPAVPGCRSIPQQPGLPWVRPAESISGSSPRRAAQRAPRCIDGRGWSAG